MFRILLVLEPNLKPKNISIDFELAAIKAFQNIFGDIEIVGCYFYFRQALYRKIQHFGFQNLYNTNAKDSSYSFLTQRGR